MDGWIATLLPQTSYTILSTNYEHNKTQSVCELHDAYQCIHVFYALSVSRCSRSGWVSTLWATRQLCTYVHANNATSCCVRKTPGRLPACGEGLTVIQWRVWAGWCGKQAQGEEEVGSEARGGVVNRDKARQMGQTMRHRHPPSMSTTLPSLL